MPTEELTIKIGTEAKTQGFTKLSSALGKFGLAMQGVREVVGLVLKPFEILFDNFDKLAEAFEELNKQYRRWEASLRGAETGVLTEQMDHLRVEMFLTGRALTDLIGLQATLNQKFTDFGNASRALSAVLDTATASGKNLNRIQEALSKGLKGRTTELQSLMPELTAEFKATDKITNQKEKEIALIELLESKYGGLRGAVNRGVVAYKNIKNAMGDMLESIGKAIFENETLQNVLFAMAGAAHLVADVLTDFITIIFDLVGSMFRLGDGIFTVENIFGAFIAVLKHVGGFILMVVSGIKMAWHTMVSGFGSSMTAVVSEILKAMDFVLEQASNLIQLVKELMQLLPDKYNPFDDMVKGLIDVNNELGKGRKKILTWQGMNTAAANRFHTDWATAAGEVKEAMDKWYDSMDEKSAKVLEIMEATKALWKELEGRATGAGKKSVETDSKRIKMTELWIARARVSGLILDDLIHKHDMLAVATGTVNNELRKMHFTMGISAMGVGNMNSMLRSAGGALTEYADKAKDAKLGQELFQSTIQTTSNVFSNMVQTIATGSKSIGDALLEGFGQAVAQLAAMFGQFLIASGTGLQALSSYGWTAAIAAGIALMAISAFISSAFSGGGKDKGAGAVSAGTAPIHRVRQQDEGGGEVNNIFIVDGLDMSENKVQQVVDFVKQGARRRIITVRDFPRR